MSETGITESVKQLRGVASDAQTWNIDLDVRASIHRLLCGVEERQELLDSIAAPVAGDGETDDE